MKHIVLLFSLALTVSAFGQTNNPYASLQSDKVIMYDFDPSGSKGGSIVEADGRLTKNILKQVRLDQLTINRVNAKLGNHSSFNFGAAACFEPHLGFVYYKQDKIVGFITICLSCNRLAPSTKLPAQKENIVDGDYAAGMSKSFRQFLNQLLKKYKFSNQIEPGLAVDE